MGLGQRLAGVRLEDGLDPQMARTLFDEGNLNFANMWVALGSMLLAAGAIMRTSGKYPGCSPSKSARTVDRSSENASIRQIFAVTTSETSPIVPE